MNERVMVNALNALRHHTGIVIPVYINQRIDRALAVDLLRANLLLCCRQVEDSATICLVADGPEYGGDVVAELAREYGVTAAFTPKNKGKLYALRTGVSHLMAIKDLRFVVSIDADGDHFANELLNLVRAAQHVESRSGDNRAMVLGSRRSKHRPLGFLRGELEEFADGILADTLSYAAATSGCPLNLQFVSPMEKYPDFHSGYKLFSATTAHDVFLAEPQLCGCSEDAYYKHGCEAVMTVEAVLNGAVLAVVERSTLNEQPVSTFGQLDRTQLMADKIVWPCKRFQVPPVFVSQWLRNHLPRLLLGTLAPIGQEELHAVCEAVMQEFGKDWDLTTGTPGGPLFV